MTGIGRDFRQAFAPRGIARLTADQSIERGRRYATEGRVGPLTVTRTSVDADVRGTEPYSVSLWVEEGLPEWDCSCPMGERGVFCKHAVAVAEVALATTAPAEDNGSDQPAGRDLPTADLLTRIDRAFRIRGYVEYHQAPDFARRVHLVLDLLRDALDAGRADDVLPLAERAAKRAASALGKVDDSDGCFGPISAEIAELHLGAALVVRPEPVDFARRLFGLAMADGDLELFADARDAYADVLGSEGCAEFDRLAAAEWETVPPSERHVSDSDGRRFRITRLMESVAESSGDADALVAVLAKDLATPWNYLRIAEVLAEAGRPDDALGWAERGLDRFGTTDQRLLDFAFTEYVRLGRTDNAMYLAWEAYRPWPYAASYTSFRSRALQAGDWPAWRDRALDAARERAAFCADAPLPIPPLSDAERRYLPMVTPADVAAAIALDDSNAAE